MGTRPMLITSFLSNTFRVRRRASIAALSMVLWCALKIMIKGFIIGFFMPRVPELFYSFGGSLHECVTTYSVNLTGN